MSLTAGEKAKSVPDQMALADERQAFTWAELDPVLNRATNAILALKLGPEERVAVFAPNCVENVIVYLAALQAGVSSVPVNFHLTAPEVAYILQDSRTRAVFAGPETVEVARKAADEAGAPLVVAWRLDGAPEGVTGWDAWLATGSDAEPPTHMPPRPHLHYTSGTTGRPKGTQTPPTMFPGGATVAELFERLRAQQAAAGGYAPAMVVSPLYHTGPVSSTRNLGGGTALVVVSRFDPEKVLQTIEKHRVVSTLMVPTHFQRLLGLPEEVRRRYDVSSLRVVSHTGAACPRDVKQAMIDWFGPVLMEAYGATESGTTNLISSPEWLQKPGSVGKTLAPFEVVIFGENGSELRANQVGEIYFRDTSGRGIIYHNDAAKTKAAHRAPGVFTLGEVGYVDDDGYVFITDRVSDMIVSGGVNIYPAETEQALIQHPEVADVAVVGAPNADMGEEVKALVIPRDPKAPPSTADLDRFCRDRIAGFKCPRSYDFVDDIGRNAMGKVNKRELKRRYWQGERTIGG